MNSTPIHTDARHTAYLSSRPRSLATPHGTLAESSVSHHHSTGASASALHPDRPSSPGPSRSPSPRLELLAFIFFFFFLLLPKPDSQWHIGIRRRQRGGSGWREVGRDKLLVEWFDGSRGFVSEVLLMKLETC